MTSEAFSARGVFCTLDPELLGTQVLHRPLTGAEQHLLACIHTEDHALILGEQLPARVVHFYAIGNLLLLHCSSRPPPMKLRLLSECCSCAPPHSADQSMSAQAGSVSSTEPHGNINTP